jgi:hypothetical protein
MNEIIVPTALAHFQAVAAKAQELRILKFVKGKYFTGDDEVPVGREYVAHMNQLNHGWVKFAVGKMVEQRVGQVAQGFQSADRAELGDNDASKWEKDAAGKPRDPWCLQYYLALEDLEDGTVLTFVTGTAGCNSAIGRLCGQFWKNAKNGLPIIRLKTSSYKHKSFGRVGVPDFPISGWTGVAGPQTAATGDELNDQIPF